MIGRAGGDENGQMIGRAGGDERAGGFSLDLATGKEMRVLAPTDGNIWQVGFSPDDRRLSFIVTLSDYLSLQEKMLTRCQRSPLADRPHTR